MTDTLDKPQPEPQSWQSDAEREGLPRTNIHDTGAPLLDRDAAIAKSLPDYTDKK
jgi:hypothetical protein